MIILPPEEKKPSLALRWIFRILLAAVVGCGLLIFVLNILSGTSDAHKRGLEQALSDVFQTPVMIGTLKSFNIFPVFSIDMENVRGRYAGDGGEVRAGRVLLEFRFFDLVFGRDIIKDLQISDLMAVPGVIGSHPLQIAYAGIVPIKAQGEQPMFKLQGLYGALPVEASLDLQLVAGGPDPVYRIKNGLASRLTIGKIGISGKFIQNEEGEPSIREAEFLLENKPVATGAFTLLTSKPQSEFKVEFETPNSKGTLIKNGDPKSQEWFFEKLALSDVISDAPVWAQFSHAFSNLSPAASTSQAETQETAISIEIRSLTGDVSGENFNGHFISTPNEFIGWWDGTLSASSVKGQEISDGKIQCGLLSLLPKGSIWSGDEILIIADPVSVLATVSVNPQAGEVKWSIDRVAAGKANTFNADLKRYADLKFPEAHPCPSYVQKEAGP